MIQLRDKLMCNVFKVHAGPVLDRPDVLRHYKRGMEPTLIDRIKHDRGTWKLVLSLTLAGLVYVEVFPSGSLSLKLLSVAAYVCGVLWPPPRRAWTQEERIANGLPPIKAVVQAGTIENK